MSLGDYELLVLAAGRGIGLEGFNKLDLLHPQSGERILERYLRQFTNKCTIVLGYRAVEIVTKYPKMKFKYNYNWFENGSAFSSFLGLNRAPVIILPSDLIISDEAVNEIRECSGNQIYGIETENRRIDAINISGDSHEITEIYSGNRKNGSDLEFTGIIRIDDQDTLERVKRICESNPNKFVIDCISDLKSDFGLKKISSTIIELNTVEQYLALFNE